MSAKNLQGILRNQRRFTDAVRGDDPVADVKHLATMLDDFVISLKTAMKNQFDFALAPQLARGASRLHVGNMVVINPNGTLSPADAPTLQGAEGVIIADNGNLSYFWSPFAVLNINVPDAAPGGPQPLWLANQGLIQATRPTSGYEQKVGILFNRNNQTGLFLSCIFPLGIFRLIG